MAISNFFSASNGTGLVLPTSYVAPVPAAAPEPKVQAPMHLFVTLSISKEKVTFQASQGAMVKKGQILVKVAKVGEGSFVTEAAGGETIVWSPEEIKDQRLILNLAPAYIAMIEKQIMDPKFAGNNGGRSMSFEVILSEFDAPVSEETTEFYFHGSLENLGNFTQPLVTPASASKIKELAMSAQSANVARRQADIQSARQKRKADAEANNGASSMSASASAGSLPEEAPKATTKRGKKAAAAVVSSTPVEETPVDAAAIM